MTGILKGYTDWPGLERVCRIVRGRTVRGQTSREVVHAVTSLSEEEASAADLLRLSRAHWGIENRLHCVRDLSFGEDRCRVRSGSAPQALAAIRNAAITLMRKLGFTNIVQGIEHFQENRPHAVSLIRYGRIE